MYHIIFKTVSGMCPKNCLHCGVPWQKKLKNAPRTPVNFMTVKDIKSFVSLNKNEKLIISFNPYGEIFSVPNMFDIFKVLEYYGKFNSLNTSLSVGLSDQQLIYLLEKFNSLSIDITYYKQEEKIVKIVSKNLLRLLELKKILNTNCDININMVYHPNEKEVSNPLFSSVKHLVSIKPLFVYSNHFARMLRQSGQEYQEWIEDFEIPTFVLKNDPNIIYYEESKYLEKPTSCVPNGINITVLGDISYCAWSDWSNVSPSLLASFGNAFKKPLSKILDTPVAQKMLKRQLSGNLFSTQICNFCPTKIKENDFNPIVFKSDKEEVQLGTTPL